MTHQFLVECLRLAILIGGFLLIFGFSAAICSTFSDG